MRKAGDLQKPVKPGNLRKDRCPECGGVSGYHKIHCPGFASARTATAITPEEVREAIRRGHAKFRHINCACDLCTHKGGDGPH